MAKTMAELIAAAKMAGWTFGATDVEALAEAWGIFIAPSPPATPLFVGSIPYGADVFPVVAADGERLTRGQLEIVVAAYNKLHHVPTDGGPHK
jgi:hypothetical protein